MRQLFSDFKNNLILTGLATLLLGGVLVVFPDASGRMICYVAAALIAVYGAVELIGYFATEVAAAGQRFSLVQGVVALLLAGALLWRPEMFLSILPLLLGIVLVVAGLCKLQSAVDLVRIHSSRWLWVLLTAVHTLLLGAVTLYNPFSAAVTLMQFIGISLVVSGVSDLAAAILMIRRLRAIDRANGSL